MGNSFEKFASSAADGNYSNVNSRRGWSRRRRRMAAATTQHTATTATAGCSAAGAAAGAAMSLSSDGLGAGSGTNGNTRRWLTHVSSTPNLGGAWVCVRVRMCLFVCANQLSIEFRCSLSLSTWTLLTLTLTLSLLQFVETTVNDALEPRSSSFSYAVNNVFFRFFLFLFLFCISLLKFINLCLRCILLLFAYGLSLCLSSSCS